MNTLSAQALLQSWERAQSAHPIRRSLALLQTAWPDVDAGEWGALPVGARDERLLALHEVLFGAEIDTLVACPACNELLESCFTTREMRPAMPADGDGGAPVLARLSCDGIELAWRLPNSDDLLEVLAADDDPEACAMRLLERCVIDARRGDAPVAASELPGAVIDQLQRDMARLDPGADTCAAFDCPACGHRFERRFDIGDYLWSALDDWAHRTLGEVHALASAYGWSEPAVLALSASRRQHYIALVQA